MDSKETVQITPELSKSDQSRLVEEQNVFGKVSVND
jgi:hypothetical protein